MKSLESKVAVITGAASGIGRALAREASARGARVVVCDVDEAGLATTVSQSSAVISRRVDVRDDAAIRALADQVASELGGADIVINNAGVSLSDTVGSMARADFERVMDINFWGVVRGTEAFLPQLLAKPEASLVNISSIFGIVGIPSQSAYCSSKFAVRGYTESLSHELSSTSVRVSVVCPGGVKTNIVRGGKHVIDSRGKATTLEATATEFDTMARTTPEAAAHTIWQGVLAGSPRIMVGGDAKALDLLARMLPRGYGGVLRRLDGLRKRD